MDFHLVPILMTLNELERLFEITNYSKVIISHMLLQTARMSAPLKGNRGRRTRQLYQILGLKWTPGSRNMAVQRMRSQKCLNSALHAALRGFIVTARLSCLFISESIV